MKATTKRAFSLLLSAAMLVGALVIYATLIRPAYQEVLTFRGTLLAKTNLLSDVEKASVEIETLQARYQGVAKLEDQLSFALPLEESTGSVLAQLNALSQSSGMALQSILFSKLPIKPSRSSLSSAKGVGSLQLELKFFGSYSALKRFLQDLERNIRLMDIKSLKIESIGRPDQDIFNYGLIVDTYYQIR